jgi:hypothetical protein
VESELAQNKNQVRNHQAHHLGCKFPLPVKVLVLIIIEL